MGQSKSVLRRLKKFAKVMVGYTIYYHIQAKCSIEKHGIGEYGEWRICPSNVTKDSVVYSLGVGEDISFDISLIENYGMKVCAFDPTPRTIEWVRSQKPPEEFELYEYAISDCDGTTRFYPPNKTEHISHTITENKVTVDRAIVVPTRKLSSVMKELGHNRIDILKMNIEGAEYDVIKDIIRCDLDVSQLLVDFHHRFDSFSIKQTKDAIKLLNEHGYKIFDIPSNGERVSFINNR